MGLIRFDPVRGFESLARRMNEMAGNIERGFSVEFGNLSPRIDISEDEKSLQFSVELPGVNKEDVKVTINDEDLLIIKGSKNREHSVEDKSFLRAERYFGEFTRSFMLPENINKDSIEAKFENGVLNINLQKSEPVKPVEKEITIS